MSHQFIEIDRLILRLRGAERPRDDVLFHHHRLDVAQPRGRGIKPADDFSRPLVALRLLFDDRTHLIRPGVEPLRLYQLGEDQTEIDATLCLGFEHLHGQRHVLFHLNAPLRKIPPRRSLQALNFHLDEYLGRLDLGGIEQRLHDLFLHAGLQAPFDFTLQIHLHFCPHLAEISVLDPEAPGERRVHFGQVRSRDFRYGYGKLRRLARYFLALIVVGKTEIERFGFAASEPDDLRLELRQQPAFTQHCRSPLAAGARKFGPLDGAAEIDGHPIAGLGGALNGVEVNALFAHDTDGLIHFRFAHLQRRAGDDRLRNVSYRDLGVYLEDCAVLEFGRILR